MHFKLIPCYSTGFKPLANVITTRMRRPHAYLCIQENSKLKILSSLSLQLSSPAQVPGLFGPSDCVINMLFLSQQCTREGQNIFAHLSPFQKVSMPVQMKANGSGQDYNHFLPNKAVKSQDFHTRPSKNIWGKLTAREKSVNLVWKSFSEGSATGEHLRRTVHWQLNTMSTCQNLLMCSAFHPYCTSSRGVEVTSSFNVGVHNKPWLWLLFSENNFVTSCSVIKTWHLRTWGNIFFAVNVLSNMY